MARINIRSINLSNIAQKLRFRSVSSLKWGRQMWNPILLFLLILGGILVVIFLIPWRHVHEAFGEKPPETNTSTPKYNLAFYTCFYGANNNAAYKIPNVPSKQYDCYYFSNNRDLLNQLENTSWIAVYDETNKPVTEDAIQSCMFGKDVKVRPEVYSQIASYDYLVFLDSKLGQVSEAFIENMIDSVFINKNYAFALRKHTFIKDSVWNEYDESMKQERYVTQKDQYLSYIHQQLEDGLSAETSVHCQCSLLIRNMKHPKITEIDDTWYHHIQKCGIQDQISFFFVKQLFENDIYPFDESPFM